MALLRLNGAQLVNRLIPAAAVQLGQLVSLRRLAPLGFQPRRSSCACRSASSARCVLSVLSSTCTRCTRRDACAPRRTPLAPPAQPGPRPLLHQLREPRRQLFPASYCLPSKPALVTRLATSWGVMASSAGTG